MLASTPFPRFELHPEVDLVLLAFGVGYWWVTRRIAPASRRQRGWFAAGLLLVWLGASWPVHDLAERYLYSVHMVQHIVFTYVGPPLLLLGTPDGVVRWLTRNPVLGWCGRWLARPLLAVALFNVLIGVSHLEPVVDQATPSAPLHFGLHLLLFSAALALWFPVVNRVDGLARLGSGGKVLYLMLNSFLVVPIVTALALGDKPYYRHYANAPRLLGTTPLSDQQVASALMWILESFWMVGAITIVFFDWYRNEQRDPSKASLPDHIRRREVPAPASASGPRPTPPVDQPEVRIPAPAEVGG